MQESVLFFGEGRERFRDRKRPRVNGLRGDGSLRVLGPRQPETLIGEIRCNNEPYPTYPKGYDYISDSDLPSTEEADGVKQSYHKEEPCGDERKGSLRHGPPRRDSLGYLFTKGCDCLVIVPVHPEYAVETRASKQFPNALVGRNQLEFATAVSRRDQESNEHAQSAAVDVIHAHVG
jgi:hypothetical protein